MLLKHSYPNNFNSYMPYTLPDYSVHFICDFDINSGQSFERFEQRFEQSGIEGQ